jgi:hypothetical protein
VLPALRAKAHVMGTVVLLATHRARDLAFVDALLDLEVTA